MNEVTQERVWKYEKTNHGRSPTPQDSSWVLELKWQKGPFILGPGIPGPSGTVEVYVLADTFGEACHLAADWAVGEFDLHPRDLWRISGID